MHVTPFNDLMWDSGATPTRVIEHGVVVPDDARCTGELERGIIVVNDLAQRGGASASTCSAPARDRVPLDLVGMGSAELGGLGEVPPPELAHAMAAYRFYFHPVRYTSLGLSLCEAMTVGVPVVGLATTELPTIIDDGVNGFTSTDPDRLLTAMRALLERPRPGAARSAPPGGTPRSSGSRSTASSGTGTGCCRRCAGRSAALRLPTGRRRSGSRPHERRGRRST